MASVEWLPGREKHGRAAHTGRHEMRWGGSVHRGHWTRPPSTVLKRSSGGFRVARFA